MVVVSLSLSLFLSLFLSYLKSVRRRLGTTVVERELQNILSAGIENGSMIPGCVVCLEIFEIPQPVAFCRVCAGGFVHWTSTFDADFEEVEIAFSSRLEARSRIPVIPRVS